MNTHRSNIAQSLRIIVVLISVVMGIKFPRAFASGDGFLSEETLNPWMEHYYVKPEPERLAQAICFYADIKRPYDDFIDWGGHIRFFVFFAALFQRDPGRMHKVFTEVESGCSDTAMFHLFHILWRTHTPESRELLIQAREALLRVEEEDYSHYINQKMAQSTPRDLLTLPGADGKHPSPNVLLSQFLATGDAAPIHRIIDLLSLEESSPITFTDAYELLVYAVPRHQRIEKMMQEAAQERGDKMKIMLQRILKEASIEQPLGKPN